MTLLHVIPSVVELPQEIPRSRGTLRSGFPTANNQDNHALRELLLRGIRQIPAAWCQRSRPLSRTLPPPPESSASDCRPTGPRLPPPAATLPTPRDPGARAKHAGAPPALVLRTRQSAESGWASLLPVRTG